MRRMTLALTVLTPFSLLLFGVLHLGQAQAEPPQQEQTVCVTASESFSGKTTAQWRAEGPAGLAELMEQMQPSIQVYRNPRSPFQDASPASQAQRAQAEADVRLLDQVAQQRDAYAAGLYWYTDLDEAKQEAKRSDKPILSLRMLGKLCDEYSCANSRFFRTALYADESVSKLLREKFVLHWQSVRPVPVITIEMGDGRVIKRTITGNSAHYILDKHGRVIECLPGLYGPDLFERLADEAHTMAAHLASFEDEALAEALSNWHARRAQQLDLLWAQLVPAEPAVNPLLGALSMPVQTLGQPLATDANMRARGKGFIEMDLAEQIVVTGPAAIDAGMIADGKFAVERPMLLELGERPTPQQSIGNDALWQRVAEHYADESRLDASSQALMRHKTVPAEQAFALVASKTEVEDPMLRMVRNFEGAVALDTAINEHLIHRQIHGWFAEAKVPMDVDALNTRVYGELFLTPEEDPWLGLVPADTYSALDQGGLIE